MEKVQKFNCHFNLYYVFNFFSLPTLRFHSIHTVYYTVILPFFRVVLYDVYVDAGFETGTAASVKSGGLPREWA